MGAGMEAEGGGRNEVSPNYPAGPAMADGMVLGLTWRISVDYYGRKFGKTNILN